MDSKIRRETLSAELKTIDGFMTGDGKGAVSHLLKAFAEEPHGRETLTLDTADGRRTLLSFEDGVLVVYVSD